VVIGWLRAKLYLAPPTSNFLHELLFPLHVRMGGVLSHDLGYSTPKKTPDSASACHADIKYANSGGVLYPRSRDTEEQVSLLRPKNAAKTYTVQTTVLRSQPHPPSTSTTCSTVSPIISSHHSKSKHVMCLLLQLSVVVYTRADDAYDARKLILQGTTSSETSKGA
jgi:hypothetical protein